MAIHPLFAASSEITLDIPGVNDQQFLTLYTRYANQALSLWQNSDADPVALLLEPNTANKIKSYNRKFIRFLHRVIRVDCSIVYEVHDDLDQAWENSPMYADWGVADHNQFCQHRDALLYYWARVLLQTHIKLDTRIFSHLINTQSIKVWRSFYATVKQYDEDVEFQDIMQASRNLWTAMGLQVLFSQKIQFHNAVLGYSMLYPYTDNLFDAENVDSRYKKQFAQRFFLMLNGKKVDAVNPLESKVQDMVQRIYNQYPINDFPKVNAAMLSIFQAQLQSLKQSDKSLSPEDILKISLFKGSATVLSDAYLIKPNLSQDEFRFSVLLGLSLQLLDDMEDMTADYQSSQRTLFSKLMDDQLTADALAVRTFNYTHSVLKTLSNLKIQNAAELKQTILGLVRILALQSIAKQPDAFSPIFYRRAQASSAYYFEDLQNSDLEQQLYVMIRDIKLPNDATQTQSAEHSGISVIAKTLSSHIQ